MILYFNKYRRFLSVFFLNIFILSLWNTQAYGMPGGPSQPEYTGFKPISNTEMVNKFSGKFSYNIPLFSMEGYPVNIVYDGSVSNDVEASWVGLGWNLNTGSINRTKRGIPDDFKGDIIRKKIKQDNVYRLGVSPGGHIQFFNALGFTVKGGVYYSTLTGFGTEASFGKSLGLPIVNTGDMTVGLGFGQNTSSSSDGGVTNSTSIGLSVGTSAKMGDKTSGGLNLGLSYGETTNSRQGLMQRGFNASLTAKVSQSAYTDKETKQNKKQFNNIKGRKNKVEFIKGLSKGKSASVGIGGIGFTKSFIDPTYTPTMEVPYKNKSYTLNLKGGAHGLYIDGGGTLDGYATFQKIADNELKKKAYGYLYSEEAKDVANRLMDFNREKDIPFHVKAPHIAIPNVTYDLYNINQHQNGGQFRAYRNDIGIMKDPEVVSDKDDYNLGLEGHGGLGFELGATLDIINSETKTLTKIENKLQPYEFNTSEPVDNPVKEAFYFKKSDETELVDMSFYDKVNGLSATNFQLKDNGGRNGILESETGSTLNTDHVQKYYDGDYTPVNGKYHRPNKRNTYISHLDFNQREKYGLQKQILNYSIKGTDNYLSPSPANLPSNLNKGLISEFSVVNPDGSKYQYGIPVLNTLQEDYSFSIEHRTPYLSNNKYTGLVEYNSSELLSGSSKSYDGFYSKEITPSYAHSWLLTEIHTPDYQDVLNDGLTDDDRGNAIKFNYTQLGNYTWRNPIDPDVGSNSYPLATHSKGVEYISNDDKAIINYGERQEWYNHSIESKNMIAFFFTSDRYDARALNKDGTLNLSTSKQQLDYIRVYSKAEISKLIKDNNNQMISRQYLLNHATPIKTIHFKYDYSLCKTTPNFKYTGDPTNTNIPTAGKLTLTDIEIKNGSNTKGYSYKFNYGGSDGVDNPPYNAKNVDRWGNFRPQDNITASTSFAPNQKVTNDAFPYVLQDKKSNDANAEAWLLKTITLPSGGTINVDYESHSYSYVQHKRTMRMYRLVGLGDSEDDLLGGTKLYNGIYSNNYLFFETDLPYVSGGYTNQKIKQLFFEDLNDYGSDKYLFYRMRTKLNPNKNKFENLPGWIEVDSYGAYNKKSSNGKQVVWVKMKPVDFKAKGHPLSVMIELNPIARNAWQFIRERIPELAWDGYTLGKSPSAFDVISSLVGNIAKIFAGEDQFEVQAIDRKLARTVLLDGNSYVRAYIPGKTKYGGHGSRVKRITISDNWDELAGINVPQSQKPERGDYTYDYEYTLTDESGNKYSSGVATYEPLIGGEENPWKQPVFYKGQMGPGGPTSMYSVEKPFGETFFPSPHVGYSSVKVISNKDKAQKLNTGNGHKVYEYITAKDYPVTTSHTKINTETLKRDKTGFTFNILGFGSNYFDRVSVSQGYSVILNDMHGKMRSEKYFKHGHPHTPKSYTTYYYKDKTSLPFINENNQIAEKEVGLHTELYTDVRYQTSTTSHKNFAPGGGLDIIPTPLTPTIWVTFFSNFNSSENTVKMAATNKVTSKSYPQYKTEVNTDGAIVTTENLLWDEKTGQVVLTKMNNEFKGKTYYKLDVPAYWNYEKLGLIYPTSDMEINMKVVNSGNSGDISINRSSRAVSNTNNYLTSGDQVYIEDIANPSATENGKYYFVSGVKTSCSGTNLLSFFIDVMGKALIPSFSASEYKVRVLRSANKNQQTTSGLNIVTVNDPRSGNSLTTNFTGVLNGSATEYSDKWKWIVNNTDILDASKSPITNLVKNPIAHGIKNNWKPVRSYAIVGNRTGFSNANEKPNLSDDALLMDNPVSGGKAVQMPYDFNGGLNTASLKNQSELTLFDSKGNTIEDRVRVTKFMMCDKVVNPNIQASTTTTNNWGDGELQNLQKINCERYKVEYLFAVDASGITGDVIFTLKNYDIHGNLVKEIKYPKVLGQGTVANKFYTYFFNNLKGIQNGTIEICASFRKANTNSGGDATLGVECMTITVNGCIEPCCKEDTTYTTTKYGYQRSLPIIAAHNAKYHEIDFCSFEENEFTNSGAEDQYDGIVPNNYFTTKQSTNSWNYIVNGGHTGSKSLSLYGSNNKVEIPVNVASLDDDLCIKKNANDEIIISSGNIAPNFNFIIGKTYKVRLWIKSDEFSSNSTYLSIDLKDASGAVITSNNNGVFLSKPIEGWRLYEVSLPEITDDTREAVLTLYAGGLLEVRNYDDIRIMPSDATAKCYVYDNQFLRLINEFDENHFATFYDYDEAGNLIRVRKETERGIVTLKESNFSYQKIK